MSVLALQRIREAKEHRLTRLDLGNCGLTERHTINYKILIFQ
jgi:hypothetical protein